jgi:hypothetical protein
MQCIGRQQRHTYWQPKNGLPITFIYSDALAGQIHARQHRPGHVDPMCKR